MFFYSLSHTFTDSGSSVLVCCSFFHPSPPLPLFYLPLSHHCSPVHPPPPASLQQPLSPLSFFHFAGKIKMISRRTLHVQRLEGIPLRSLSISLPVPSWSVCLPAVTITTSSITLAPAVVCSPVIKTMFDTSVMKPVSQVVPVWRVHRACFVKLKPVEMSSSYTSDQNYLPRTFFLIWQKSLTHWTFFIKTHFINVPNFCLEIMSCVKYSCN